MGRDKKRDAGGMRMVVLEDFGKPIVVPASDEVIGAGLEAIGIKPG